MASRNRQPHRLEKMTVWWGGRRFERWQYSARRLKHDIFVGLSEGRNRDDLADDLSTVIRIRQDLGQGGIVCRGENGIDKGSSGGWLCGLGDDWLSAGVSSSKWTYSSEPSKTRACECSDARYEARSARLTGHTCLADSIDLQAMSRAALRLGLWRAVSN